MNSHEFGRNCSVRDLGLRGVSGFRVWGYMLARTDCRGGSATTFGSHAQAPNLILPQASVEAHIAPSRVQGPQYYNINSFGALKPYDLGPSTFRGFLWKGHWTW